MPYRLGLSHPGTLCDMAPQPATEGCRGPLVGPFSRLTWHFNNLIELDPFPAVVFAWRPNWRFRIGPRPPGAQKMAKRAPLELFGLIHKQPGHNLFFAENQFSLADEFVFMGLVVRSCHFDVTACAKARRLDNWKWSPFFPYCVVILKDLLLKYK